MKQNENSELIEGLSRAPKVTILEKYTIENDYKFNKGDIVSLLKIPGPEMVVLDVVFEEGKHSTVPVYGKTGGKILLGISCGWFTDDKYWMEKTFNSKDLCKDN